MTPETFIKKWQDSELKERSASQSHFNDLCALLGEPNPTDADQAGEWFCFEKGAKKTGGGDGWADVWKRGHFGWEYKGPGKDLNKAYAQLQRYAVALENPSLLVVSDCRDIIIHSNFTNAVYETHTILIEEIGQPENLQKLKWLFTDPERLRPGQTREAVTEGVAKAFAGIAQRLRDDGHDPHKTAHFVNRLLFCMFAEDIELLPDKLFTRMLEACEHAPERFAPMASELFAKMNTGGYFGADEIAWFNGGLFDDGEALSLDADGVKQTLIAARMDWSSIEPSIFGTMFERGLDPAKRSQLGAHYTDAGKIMLIIEPVILRPLRQEWDEVKTQIELALEKVNASKSKSARTKGMQKAQSLLGAYLDRLRNVRVLDPACGSGNFLYLALMNLKDLEHRVLLEAEAMGLGMQLPQLGPEVVKGIEINAYAAELARVTVWIGQIQWMISHGFSANRKPILEPLDTIENRDALIESKPCTTEDTEGTEESQNRTTNTPGHPLLRERNSPCTHELTRIIEAEWPEAEFIVGNPPFLGDKKMIAELGEEYTKLLRGCYKGRVPGGSDLVTYWFEKARDQMEQGKARQAGLVATNSIRQKRNRPVLERICKTGRIFNARSDEPWVNEGAAVRVSLISFSAEKSGGASLDGESMAIIFANLQGLRAGAEMTRNVDLTKAGPLKDNKGWSYFGLCLAGKFKVSSDIARQWLHLPNPHGKPNSDVLKPIYNGSDITQHWKGNWVVDFGPTMTEQDAALYEAPFAWIVEHVKPVRINNNRKARAVYWWRHGEARPGLRAKLEGLNRYIATPETAKYRFFVWFPLSVAPEHSLIVIPRDDDVTFGILSSRIHTLWALVKGGRMGKGNDPRYNSSVTFETFPFPSSPNVSIGDPCGANGFPTKASGMTDNPIAIAAKRLDELRNNWLNPPEWVERIPEVAPGYPDRIVAKPGHEADLKKRTLTNLYNARPAWLDNIHKELDAAVAAAYGWDDYTPAMPDEEILARLFTLNQERVKK